MNSPVVDFILNTYKVKDISNIKDPFNLPNGIPVWEPARIVNTEILLVKNDQGYYVIPPPDNPKKYQPKQLYNNMPIDLNCVSIFNISIRYVKNHSYKDEFYVRHNFVPFYNQKEHDIANKAKQASGRIPNVCYEITKGQDAIIREIVFASNPNRIEMYDYFIKTFMFLENEEQLMQGIYKIDPEICAKQNLPKIAQTYDNEGIQSEHPVNYYVLVPYNHVLAWELHCSDMWRKKEIIYKEMDIKKQGIFAIDIEVTDSNENVSIPFFLVDDVSFEKLKNGFVKDYIGKVDKRPLSNLQFELLDKQTGKHSVNPPVDLRIGVSFIAYPDKKPYPPFYPMLHPEFVEFEKVLQQMVEFQRRLKEQEQYEKRVENIKIKK